MNQEKGNDQFHANDFDDLYDLYNACNGVLHNGLLDIRRLGAISEDERHVLDIPRLIELGAHLRSGCAECEAIVNTLNFARRLLRDQMEESSQGTG